jgi:hypothetical protein
MRRVLWQRDGVDSNLWTAAEAGVEGAPAAAAVLAAGTDGGASWQEKKMRRAVEEAQSSGKSLEQARTRARARTHVRSLPRRRDRALGSRALAHPLTPVTTQLRSRTAAHAMTAHSS